MTPQEFGSHFDPLYDTFTNLAALPINSRPLHLAHYTSISALEKIVRSNEIWFSNPLFMNDQEEMRFGVHEARRILQEWSAGSRFTDLEGGMDNFNKIMQHYNDFLGKFEMDFAFDVYLFCLSEYDVERWPEGRLSMWRGYGANGNGVALVFNTSFISVVRGSPFFIAKVRYGNADQRAEWIKESFSGCLKVLSQNAIFPQRLYMTAWHFFD